MTFVSELEKLTTKMKESSNIPSHHEKSKIPALPDEKEVKEPAVTLKCRLCYKEVKELLGQSLAAQSILSLLLGLYYLVTLLLDFDTYSSLLIPTFISFAFPISAIFVNF